MDKDAFADGAVQLKGPGALKQTKRIASETEAGLHTMVENADDDEHGDPVSLMTIDGKTSNAFDIIAASSVPKAFKSSGSQRSKKARTQMMTGIKGSFGIIELA